MDNKTFEEIVLLWQADKKQYVKRSTYSAYSLLIRNHLLLYTTPHEASPFHRVRLHPFLWHLLIVCKITEQVCIYSEIAKSDRTRIV